MDVEIELRAELDHINIFEEFISKKYLVFVVIQSFIVIGVL